MGGLTSVDGKEVMMKMDWKWMLVLIGVLLLIVAAGLYYMKSRVQIDPDRAFGSETKVEKAQMRATELFVIKQSDMTDTESVMMASLQGLTANLSDKQIYILPGAARYETWLEGLGRDYDISLDHTEDPWEIVAYYADIIDGYLLYQKGNDSINAAASLAKHYNSVLISPDLISKAEEAGLSTQADLRDKDERWVVANHMDKLSKTTLVEQKEKIIDARLRDYGIMAGALTFFDGNSDFRKEIVNQVNLDAMVYGWGDASKGEDKFVGMSSAYGIATLPADHAYNVSVFSGLDKAELIQPNDGKAQVEEGVHYVAFVMSDGDNLQWLLNDFSNDGGKWFGNENRGNFSMGWGMAPTMIDLAPSVMGWYYDQLSTGEGKDSFIVGPSGNGYLYPSRYPEDVLKHHVDSLNTYMERTDLSVVEIIDFNALNDSKVWDIYTAQPAIEGLIYLEYSNHGKHKGKVKWSNGKPVVTPRFMLWEGLRKADNQSVLDGINNAPRDPGSIEGYSVVLVHAWSKTMEDIQGIVDGLNEDVRVVTPDELIYLMTDNCAPEE